MKWWILILSFYMLALSLVPCNDIDSHSEASVSGVALAEDRHHDYFQGLPMSEMKTSFGVMKLFSLFFALVVLLESTVMMSCLKDVRFAEKDSCCIETCETGGQQDTDEDCDSGCNPFQHCGCCKGANVLEHFSSLQTLGIRESPFIQTTHYQKLLPEGIRLYPKRPPRS